MQVERVADDFCTRCRVSSRGHVGSGFFSEVFQATFVKFRICFLGIQMVEKSRNFREIQFALGQNQESLPAEQPAGAQNRTMLQLSV